MLPTTSLNCDFVCVETKSATLVEVKAVRPRLIADMTKDYATLRTEFGRDHGVAHGLAQINESALIIRSGAAKVPKRTILSALLVLRGEQVFLNSGFVRNILEELVEEQTGHRVIVKYQIVNDLGFHNLVEYLATGRSLSGFLYSKCRDPREDTEDTHHTIARILPVRPEHPLRKIWQDGLTDLMRDYGVDPERVDAVVPARRPVDAAPPAR